MRTLLSLPFLSFFDKLLEHRNKGKLMKHTITFCLIALTLAGCSTTVQTTSGEGYLSQYKYVPIASSASVVPATDGSNVEQVKSIDQRVREVAAVEPILKFPARIGLARIDNGTLTLIPSEEMTGWEKTREKLGESYGEFIPVNPIVARMVADSNRSMRYADRVDGIISTIRLAAARQHLDAVLIYEVLAKESQHSNILSAANVSIIGAYILPSKQQEVEGLGNALLIDVIQGYPYGTATTVVEKKTRMVSSWGWGSDYSDKTDFANIVKMQAGKQLSEEAYDMFVKVRVELEEKRKK
ncbi:MAG: hypothetical protein V1721_07800 [Pseudomonadota bacterium]